MASSPLRPLALPAQQRKSATSSPTPLAQSTVGESSSASSSVAAGVSTQTTRADQVVYRYYLKTVAVLGEGRLTHYGAPARPDKKKDKWFNLGLPEFDLHKADLAIYRSISSYTVPRPTFAEPANGGTIPPLLVAFILDTSDLPNGQALMWNRESGKVALDVSMLGGASKGKAKQKEQKSGIILERWTLQASPSQQGDVASSQMAAHTAYRLGIIHFRSLYALIRLLPAYRLYRRLRRANNGLRLGIKLWGPEGYLNTPEDLAAAWEVMESDLISLDFGLDQLAAGDSTGPDNTERYSIPSVDLFGTTYSLAVDFRTEVDFSVEDMESVLSEKFVDMDEDWFTPTVARHRLEEENNRATSGDARPSRRVSNPTAIPATSPIPHRQQAAAPGSFGSVGLGGSKPSTSRLPSGTVPVRPVPSSHGSGRWGAMAEGLPFATPSAPSDIKDPASPSVTHPPSGASMVARRLSGHSINMSSSPSTSLLRSTPPTGHGTPPLAHRPGSSVGRTSSFLSQSGRSFTHAQLANMSPPIDTGLSPISPSSLSFTKQPVPRSLSGRGPLVPQSSSPIIPGSFEREASTTQTGSIPVGSATTGPLTIKRYASSLSQRQNRLAGSGGSADTPILSSSPNPAQSSQSLLRRTSTRTSQESGLRHSSAPTVADDEISSFLKALDHMPQPPTLAANAAHASRSHLPSTSSSLSNPSHSASPSPLQASGNSPVGQASQPVPRAPLTRAAVDDQLKRLVGSFAISASQISESSAALDAGPSRQRTPSITSTSGSNAPSVGLLTASRPASAARRSNPAGEMSPRYAPRRQSSITAPSPLAGSPSRVPLPESPNLEQRKAVSSGLTTARSLPGVGSAPLAEDVPLPTRISNPPTTALSPQTTGTSTATNESRTSGRRGPVLLRGGFDSRPAKPGSSPSHSPIRDFARLNLGSNRPQPSLGSRGESMSLGYGYGRKTAGQRTAPSSFGMPDLDGQSEDAGESPGGRGRREGRRSEGGMSPREDEEIEGNLRKLGGDW